MTIDNHTVTVQVSDPAAFNEMDAWCRENTSGFKLPSHEEVELDVIMANFSNAIGQKIGAGNVKAAAAKVSFTFESELDAVHFRLRWSEYL
jgi:hypothetical protein